MYNLKSNDLNLLKLYFSFYCPFLTLTLRLCLDWSVDLALKIIDVVLVDQNHQPTKVNGYN